MGDPLYDALLANSPDVRVRVYAPVGAFRDLLAYLVRRLLENGSNTSFVHQITDRSVPSASLVEDVHELARAFVASDEPASALPTGHGLFGTRRNSRGIDLQQAPALIDLTSAVERASDVQATSIIDGARTGLGAGVRNPASLTQVDRDGRQRGRRRRRTRGRRGARGLSRLGSAWSRRPRGHRRPRRRRMGSRPRRTRRAGRARGRPHDARRALRGARGDRLLPVLRRGRSRTHAAAAAARPGRRIERIAAGRPRRLRVHQPLELPARDLRRAGRRRAGRGQRRGREARGADSARRLPRGAADARGWRAARTSCTWSSAMARASARR